MKVLLPLALVPGGHNIRTLWLNLGEHCVCESPIQFGRSSQSQATVGVGLAEDCEAGQVAFFCLAERARSRGKRPGALFTWVLREKKLEFITQVDEEGPHGDCKRYVMGRVCAKTAIQLIACDVCSVMR